MESNAKLEAFREKIRGETVGVVGIGISNRPVIDFLLGLGAKVTARDKKSREVLGEICDHLQEEGVTLCLGEDYLENLTEHWIFKAPGLRFDLPQFQQAVARGAVLTSEMEVFLELCPCPVFAITGSDGKTTTTTLCHHMLSEECQCSPAGGQVYVGGNIGKPLLPEVEHMTHKDFAVVELSSFQLHTMKLSPSHAAITNLSPNHLNWHTDMAEYIDAKCNIFRHQSPDGNLILNYDNEVTRSLAKEARGNVTYFSRTKQIFPTDRIFATVTLDNDWITLHSSDGTTKELVNVNDVLLPGNHNIENYMTAIALVHDFVSPKAMVHVAKTFTGVEHRIELVCEKNGVRYYNSSIDSSPTRTIAALSAFEQKVILIMGGYDKHIPFSPLGEPVAQKAQAVVLTGATMPKIKEALLSSEAFLCAGIPLYEHPDFADAIHHAAALSKPGDIVLFSPACASFDAFPNFEVRGNTFKDLVNHL